MSCDKCQEAAIEEAKWVCDYYVFITIDHCALFLWEVYEQPCNSKLGWMCCPMMLLSDPAIALILKICMYTLKCAHCMCAKLGLLIVCQVKHVHKSAWLGFLWEQPATMSNFTIISLCVQSNDCEQPHNTKTPQDLNQLHCISKQ